MKKNITIKDIARQLNVSVATVSRALRNASDISKETKKAVLDLAKELNYHPNLLASSLSSRKSNVLGVVVPTINRQFWSNSISGIENVAYKAGYKVMIFQSAELYSREVEILETLANSQVDGILLAFSKETENFEHVTDIIERGIPVTLFERVLNLPNTSKIVTDDYTGSKQVVMHLIETGKKRIGYLCGPKSLQVCQDRLAGYKDAIISSGLEWDESLIEEIEEFSYEKAGEGFKNMWRKEIRPDAVFSFADIIAVGVLKAAEEMGIDVPRELAVAGFGNDDISMFIKPSLTTMAQPSFEIGQRAARLLLEQIENETESFNFRTEIVKPLLIIRESS